MIVLLGASGYVGQAFQRELRKRGEPFIALSRAETNYTRYDVLTRFLQNLRPSFLINAAGYTGNPNVDACESARADTLQGNTLFPLTVSHACRALDIPWGHISSGCIYTGAKIVENDEVRIERDLTRTELQGLLQSNPSAVQGFREDDPPNFSFRQGSCSFYSGTKALAEESLAHDDRAYLWRLRIPFDEWDHARNYLSKLQRYSKIYQNINSLSHLGDAVAACLDLWKVMAPFGAYNVTNPGYVSSRQVAAMIQQTIAPNWKYEFWNSDQEFYQKAAIAPRSNCVLDVGKLLATGVKMRPVDQAIEDALRHWVPEVDDLRNQPISEAPRPRSIVKR